MNLRPTIAVALTLLGSAGCTCGPPPRTEAEQFDLDLAWIAHAGLCEYLRRCCTDAERGDQRPLIDAASGLACQTESDHDEYVRSRQRDSRLNAAVTTGRVRFHADRAAGCLEAARRALPAPTTCVGPAPTGLHPEWRIDALAECRSVFEGTLASDATCTIAEECASDWCNERGRCRPRGGAGAPCAPDGDWCALDLACVDGRCAARGAEGEPCATSAPEESCTEGTRCVDARCVALAADGAACTSHDRCRSLSCVGGLCVSACGSR